MEEEREPERRRQTERHRDRGEDERVRHGDPEDVVLEQLAEVVEPDEARRADEVVLGDGQRERHERGRGDEEREPQDVRREEHGELTALAHAGPTRSPVASSKRWTSSGRMPTRTSSPGAGRASASVVATRPLARWT